MKYCRNCDKSFKRNISFCPHCGSRLLSKDEVKELKKKIADDLAKEKAMKKAIKNGVIIAEKALAFQEKYQNELELLEDALLYQEKVYLEYNHVLKKIINKEYGYEKFAIALSESLNSDIYFTHMNMTPKKMVDIIMEKYQEYEKRFNEINDYFSDIASSCFNELSSFYYLKALIKGGNFSSVIKYEKKEEKRNYRTDFYRLSRENTKVCDIYEVHDYTVIDYRFNGSFLERLDKNILHNNSDTVGLYYYLYLVELKIIKGCLDQYNTAKDSIDNPFSNNKKDMGYIFKIIQFNSMQIIYETPVLEALNDIVRCGAERHEIFDDFIETRRQCDV